MTEAVREPTSGAAPESRPAFRRDGRWLPRILIRLLVLAAVVAIVGPVMVRLFQQVDWRTLDIQAAPLVTATTLLLLQAVLAAVVGHLLLRGLGADLRPRDTLAVLLSASLGRYIPGKVVAVSAAAVLLVRRRVPFAVAASGLVLTPALNVLVMLVLAVPLLLYPPVLAAYDWAWLLAAVLVLPGLVLLHPAAFVWAVNRALRLAGRDAVLVRPRVSSYAGAAALIATNCVLIGTALFLVARSFEPVETAQLPFFIMAAVLGGVSTFLTPFAPAGLGVLEGLYIVVLGPVIGPEVAVLVLLVRLLRTVADMIAGATGLIMLHHRPAAEPSAAAC